MINRVSTKPLFKFSIFVNSVRTSSSSNSNSNSTSCLVQISHFSNYSSNNAVSPSHSHQFRRQEEGNRNVRVSVWWDFENCQVPGTANVYKVAQCITSAIRANGIKGPIQITAFGDVMQISRLNQEALSSTGINLTHIPRVGKNSADRSLLVDLMCWVAQNPPPAHLFLISGDRDFAGVLHRLRMNNYNILLASPDSVASVLCSAATIMWHWNSLLKGENLVGKHFNHPPDGPHSSLYGHYKVPLEDPFSVAEDPVCPKAENPPDSSPDKVHPIPKKIVKQISKILHVNPKGILITDLRAELSKNSINIEKDFYGYKKFSSFLLAMPNVLKLQRSSNGQILVCGLPPLALEQEEHSPGVTTDPVQNGKEHSAHTSRLNGENSSYIQNVYEKADVSLALETSINHGNKQQFFSEEVQTAPQQLPALLAHEPERESTTSNLQDNKVHNDPQEVHETPALIQGVEGTESTQAHLAQYNPVSEFFRRMWRKWFVGDMGVSLEGKSGTTGVISTEKLKSKQEDLNSTIQQDESVDQTLFSSSSNETETNEKSSKSSNFLSKIMRLWGGSAVSDGINETLKEKPDQIGDNSENGIFAKESFWSDVKAFIDSPEGAAVVRLSKSRAQMAENFGKQGPQCVRSLSEAYLLHLVNLIILDKKWIEESPSQAIPFKVIPSEDSSSSSNPSGSVCSSNESRPVMFQKLEELHRHRNIQSSRHAGSSYPIAERNISRNQIVLDCQKLVSELLKECPEGFSLGKFRKAFSEKYGYPLDVHKVGHEKLSTFLETIPGVTVASSYLFPSRNQKSRNLETAEPFGQESEFRDREANSESEQSDEYKNKDDDLDSLWEELGPLSNTAPQKRFKTLSGPSWKLKGETQKKIQNEYESLSDDNFSDTEEETSSSLSSNITSESKKKSPTGEAGSSLLQILDSWFKTKDDDDCKKQSGSEDIDVNVVAPPAAAAESSVKNPPPPTPTPRTNDRKQRHSTSYSWGSWKL